MKSTMTQRMLQGLAMAAAVALFPLSQAAAQADYPNRQITVVLGLAAGGGADVLTRYFSDKLSQQVKQPVIVENKPGAIGNIAAEAVARARPDGYTILIAPNTSWSAAMHLFKKINFDPVKDFVPVATLLKLPFVLTTNPEKTPAKTVAELTTFLKAKGDKASFGSPTGTSLGASELYKSLTGVTAVQVPYRSMQQATTELGNGEIDFLFADATFIMEQVKTGKYRALAVTTEKRSSAIPDLPTMPEAGVTGFYEISAWFAAGLPAGTPPAIADKLNGIFQQILVTEETKKFLLNIYADPFPGSRQDMATFQAKEIAKWGEIVRLAKIEPQ
jgi:tripartite-type tricarboxylate transporter receptor subunit TctC